MTMPRSTTPTLVALLLMQGSVIALLSSCASEPKWVDSRLETVLQESSRDIGGDAETPGVDGWMADTGTAFPPDRSIDGSPPTDNPPADELRFQAQSAIDDDARSVVERIQAMAEVPEDARLLDLPESLRFATLNALEYINAEQDYLLAALALLIEAHRWNPSFFNNLTIDSELGDFLGLEGRYENALTVVNDFGVSQKLPYGGEVSASFLVGTTNLLDESLLGSSSFATTADLVLSADIPLLRGAGMVAREPLIQAQRNLIYAARSFETFRRSFYLQLVTDYLDLVVQQQSIDNARRSVQQFQEVESRASALVRAGRLEPFQADQARQDTLFEIDRLSGLEESYRLGLDRFKLEVGMNTDEQVRIDREMLDLLAPAITQDEAVMIALRLRLDIQTARDQVEDLRRQVDLAENGLLADLNISGGVIVPFDDPGNDLGIDGSPDDVSFQLGMTFSAPLDRVIEKYQLRQAQIRLEQGIRGYRNARDEVALQVRSQVREIERAQFSVLLQERNVEIAENRRASIEAAPDRASTRDRTEAVNALRRAEDQRDRATRDLQISILQYLNASGRLRVKPDGTLLPLPGMKIEDLEQEDDEAISRLREAGIESRS